MKNDHINEAVKVALIIYKIVKNNKMVWTYTIKYIKWTYTIKYIKGTYKKCG